MKDIFLNFKNEIDLSLRNLAEQDFKEAVQHLFNLKKKISFIINTNEVEITKKIDRESIGYETMKPNLPSEFIEFNGIGYLTNVMDLKDLKVKNVYIEFGNHRFIFDFNENKWIEDF